jgi:hypothetical protein
VFVTITKTIRGQDALSLLPLTPALAPTIHEPHRRQQPRCSTIDSPASRQERPPPPQPSPLPPSWAHSLHCVYRPHPTDSTTPSHPTTRPDVTALAPAAVGPPQQWCWSSRVPHSGKTPPRPAATQPDRRHLPSISSSSLLRWPDSLQADATAGGALSAGIEGRCEELR